MTNFHLDCSTQHYDKKLTIWMKHLGSEHDSGSLVWVFLCEDDAQPEGAIFEGGVVGSVEA